MNKYVGVCALILDGVVGYMTAPNLPFGPVAQFYRDEKDINERMSRGMTREVAKNDLLIDRKKEQRIINNARREEYRRRDNKKIRVGNVRLSY